MNGIRRLLLLLGAAVIAFAVALVSFSEDAEAGCALDAAEDAAYASTLEGEPSTEQMDYVLVITRNGQPVDGARVCLTTTMTGMSAMATTDEAEGVGNGRYRISIDFAMAGPWSAMVLVREQGNTTVALPLDFDVK